MKLWVSIFMTAIVLGLGSGCGRSDTIYSDGGDNIVVIEHSALPDGFYDQSVNRADAMSSGNALRLRIRGGESVAGSFNDATLKGSRATVGLGGNESKLLADFALHVDSTSSTTSNLRVSVLLDLKCDDGDLHSIETTVGVGSNDVSSAWKVSGSPIQDSTGSDLLTSTPSSLTALLQEYPDACLKNGVSDAPDAPVSIPLASVQLSIGSGTSISPEEVQISSLVLNGETYSSWSLQ